MPSRKCDFLQVGSAVELPYPDNSFDLVISINVLHNLYIFDLYQSLAQIERISRGPSYVVNDSYRTEEEKVNLMYWQLTCECFYTPQEWEWIFSQGGFTGDYSFICYE
jgi:ubiquinone/menaquinone biosynthesis C-methylase UbiE